MKLYQIKLKILAMTVLLFNIFQYSANGKERLVNNQEEKVPIEKFNLWDCSDKVEGDVIIDSEEAYVKLKKQYFANCAKGEFPVIDFNKNTLIGSNGVNYDADGCDSLFMIQVTRDNQNRIYHHSLVFYADAFGGSCHVSPLYHSWILVPKLPKGYIVQFSKGKDPSIIIYHE